MKILEIILAIGLFGAVIVGMLFLLGVFTEEDYENWKRKISDPVKDFLAKVRSPEKRANMNLKENWVLWLSWSFFGIVFGIWFYIVGLGAVAMVKVMNFLGLRKEQQEKDQQQEEEEETSLWESIKIGFLKRAKDPEERKKMDVDEYLMFMMLTTLPFSIPTVGLYLYFFAIGVLIAIIIAEKVSGYHFANIADLKAKISENGIAEKDVKIAELESQLAEKTGELEKVQNAVNEAIQKTKAKEMKAILEKVRRKDGFWVETN